ncbi:uncharacterized protein LOC122929232 isoform X2 [Bufo gargarizans]|uniref:uncharacterized protein LOC122929232 isoform X2 n=1 Tax=Bufo gargarizans TaxID=30331 RepID=UPI001CF25E99|nr:uncharacterized protein LOC122929232 isoform X2 [Bufo gargarizans]
MKATSLLLLFFAIQEGRSNGEDETYCTEQRGTVIVEEKGSVTIPCNFTYSNPKGKPVDVRVSWKRSKLERCGDGETIYNHTRNWTHENYIGRISWGGNPNGEKKATITINDLRRTDGPTICCRMEIYVDNTYKDGFQNRHGTNIKFKDEFSVEQTDVVPAMIGEDITIPCFVHYKDPSVIDLVSWHIGSSDVCAENNENSIIWNQPITVDPGERWSVVAFPQDLSLRLKGVTSEDIKQYCCRVRTKLRNNIASSTHGTEVVLVDNSINPEFEVLQPEKTSSDVDGSATISCSYKYQSDTNLLWTGVFWRVSSPNGSYAYHPFPAMVHSTYRGRTELRGLADLRIKGVKDTDNTTYYCFVMLKFCVGKNKSSSTIHYGRGTKLDITRNEIPDSNTWLYALVAGLLVLIILCAVIFIILKKRGIICQTRSGREDVKYLTSNIALKDQNSSGNVQEPAVTSSTPPTAQEVSGEVLYAHLNESSLQQKTSNGSKRRKSADDSQVVYAAVKPTSAPQDIYATVQERR